MTFGKILAQVKGAYMWRTCILLIVPVHELPSWQRISKDIILLMSVMLCEVSVCKMQVKRLTFLIYKALLLPGFNYFRFSLRISINRWIKYFRVALVSAFRKPRHRFWQGKSFLGGGRDATCKVFSSSLQQYINIKLHRIVWHPYLIRNNEYSKPRCWDKEERRTSIKKWMSWPGDRATHHLLVYQHMMPSDAAVCQNLDGRRLISTIDRFLLCIYHLLQSKTCNVPTAWIELWATYSFTFRSSTKINNNGYILFQNLRFEKLWIPADAVSFFLLLASSH